MERPSIALERGAPPSGTDDLVAGYVARAAGAGDRGAIVLPGGPRLYMLAGGSGDAWLTLRGRRSEPLPRIGVIGPTTRAAQLEHGDAVLLGVRLRATAWAALFDRDLSRVTDRVVPLTALDVAPPPLADPQAGAAAAFAGWFAARPAARGARAGLAQQVAALIDADPRIGVAALCTALGVTPAQLSTRCLRDFGLPPKRLLVLRRFGRVLRRLLGDATATGRVLWEAGYVDHSHFAKDCRRFLDTSLHGFRQRLGDGGEPL